MVPSDNLYSVSWSDLPTTKTVDTAERLGLRHSDIVTTRLEPKLRNYEMQSRAPNFDEDL